MGTWREKFDKSRRKKNSYEKRNLSFEKLDFNFGFVWSCFLVKSMEINLKLF